MATKAKQVYTVSSPGKGVILWDTTLKPLVDQLKKKDPEAHGYDTITRKLQKGGSYAFKTKSDIQYLVQHLLRDTDHLNIPSS